MVKSKNLNRKPWLFSKPNQSHILKTAHAYKLLLYASWASPNDLSIYRLKGLRKGDKHPTYAPAGYGTFTVPIFYYMTFKLLYL